MSEASYWLVKDLDFMNVAKLLSDDMMAELYCLSIVEVWELPLDEIEHK